MTKAEMMNELDDVFTDRRLTRPAVERALAEAGPEPATLLGSYLALTSGGSSGQRGVFVLDQPAAVQFFGTLTRGLVARLEAMGGPPPGGLPIAMVAAGSPVHATGIAAPLCEGDTALPFRFLGVPVTQPLSEIVEQLNALQAPALYGYPSMLARLAREREAGRLRISPMMVTSTSETCTPELRAAISTGFGAPLIDSFGSTEGLVGASAPDDDVITFAEDGCIVELVDEHHRPVPPGTPSAAVLVTNLSNRLQPLIRYELTDTFVQQPAASEHGYLRARVSGRSDEGFRYGEVTVHPLVIRTVMVQVARGGGVPGAPDIDGDRRHRGRGSRRSTSRRSAATCRPRSAGPASPIPRSRSGRRRTSSAMPRPASCVVSCRCPDASGIGRPRGGVDGAVTNGPRGQDPGDHRPAEQRPDDPPLQDAVVVDHERWRDHEQCDGRAAGHPHGPADHGET